MIAAAGEGNSSVKRGPRQFGAANREDLAAALGSNYESA
jgi:hypothetical protein